MPPQADERPPFSTRQLKAWLGVFAATLTLEYALLAIRFDGLMRGRQGWWEHLTEVIAVASLMAATAAILFSTRVRQELSAVAQTTTLPTLWLTWRIF